MFFTQKLKFQQLSFLIKSSFLFGLLSFCPILLAAQDAIVLSERAIIYSDKEMKSPIGFIRKGRKISVGEIPRNNAQVYPIVVSGKIAYIRVLDLTVERESVDADRLVAERFRKAAIEVKKQKIVLSYLRFNSTVSMDQHNDALMSGDVVSWNGVSFKGEVLLKSSWDLQVMINYMMANTGKEKFAVTELGAGGAYRLIDTKKFLLRAEAQFLGIPFSSYEFESDFLKRSYGYTIGTGVAASYWLSSTWAIEGSLGYYRTHLLKFKSPEPYNEISPVFSGTRVTIGLNYSL